MAARRSAKAVSLPEPPEPPCELAGDIAFRLRQRSLVLTAALDGLRLYEGVWHDDGWRERVTAVWDQAFQLELDMGTLYAQMNAAEHEKVKKLKGGA